MKIGVDIGGTKCAVVLGDENGIAKKSNFQPQIIPKRYKTS